jgi:hypothetical protein
MNTKSIQISNNMGVGCDAPIKAFINGKNIPFTKNVVSKRIKIRKRASRTVLHSHLNPHGNANLKITNPITSPLKTQYPKKSGNPTSNPTLGLPPFSKLQFMR